MVGKEDEVGGKTVTEGVWPAEEELEGGGGAEGN